MRASRLAKLAAANAAGVVLLWAALLAASAVVEDVYLLVKGSLPRRQSERVALPNYPDKEAAQRLFADFKKLEEEYVPFLEWTRSPLVSETVNIGADGWRSHTRGPENDAPDARTLGFYGGSTMFGKGAEDDATIPALFDQQTTGWRVRNYGQTGYTTRQMLEVLENQLATRELPEAVVFYDGYNHIWTHCNYAVTRSLSGHMAEPQLRRALAEKPPWGYAFDEIVTPLVRRVRRVLGSDRQGKDEWACDRDPARAEQVAETLVRNWELARLLVERWGGRFHAFLQPVAYVGSPRLDHLEIDHAGEGAQFRAVYPLIRAKLAERGASWASDLSAAFDGDAYLYIDDCHVSPAGNEIIARAMRERVGDR
jgi:hypothetical protein